MKKSGSAKASPITYILSTSMVATRDTMSLASTVLGFDIFELWTESQDEKLHCTYVHATQSIKEQYPELITGHFPAHKAEHKLSPQVLNNLLFITDHFLIISSESCAN